MPDDPEANPVRAHDPEATLRHEAVESPAAQTGAIALALAPHQPAMHRPRIAVVVDDEESTRDQERVDGPERRTPELVLGVSEEAERGDQMNRLDRRLLPRRIADHEHGPPAFPPRLRDHTLGDVDTERDLGHGLEESRD